jgi:HAE1 family hydrophobic/amphiphilic exporter-1
VRLALEQNNDVAIGRLETQASRQNVHAAEGVFDPVFVPTLSYQRAVSPVASALGGAAQGTLEQNQFAGGLQFAGLAPWAGGRFTADFTSLRIESSNQFAQLNPQYPASLGLAYVQPLFRGREIDVERRQILLARETADLTDAQLARVLIEQLTLVEQAYWDLVFATRNLEVQVAAVEQARAQVASNERQVQAGTLAPIDVIEAQTQLANFQLSAAAAQQTLTEAENRLKIFMLTARTAPEWDRPLVPAEPADRPAPALSLEDATRAALARRPELTELEAVRAQNDIDRRFFGDEARPQVDIVGNYSLSGLAGAPLAGTGNPLGGGTDAALLARLNELSLRAGLDPLASPPPTTGTSVPTFLSGGYGQSLSNIVSGRFPTVLLQLQVGIPLTNRTAEANFARTGIIGTRIRRQRQQLEQLIEAEVRNALEAVQTSQARLAAAAAARRNALEQYQSEQRRFEAGLSTVFFVLQRQTALVTAQAQELRARADLNQAAALLDRATGATLERHGVTLSR